MAARKRPKSRPVVANAAPSSEADRVKMTVRVSAAVRRKLLHLSIERGEELGRIVEELVERAYGGCYWAERSPRPTLATPPVEPIEAAGPGDDDEPRLAG